MKDLLLPQVIFGTSGLGNLYVAKSDTEKLDIVAECIRHSKRPVVFDSAGKYGAGLALESLGKSLKKLNVAPEDVLISNKLGWLRTELTSSEPTFEPGVWKDLKYDARQRIGYDGILECYEQGNELLNGYTARLVSVHDPDEYLAGALTNAEKEERYQDIIDAYIALGELKLSGKVSAVGIGSKDWRIIERISKDIRLDWVMIANSMTVHSHPLELLNFMKELKRQSISVINSAVFNGGFLTGSDFYNYHAVNAESHPDLYHWRTLFYQLCDNFKLKPAEVCANFGLNVPGVTAIALNTTNPKRVADNIAMTSVKVPAEFWQEMKRLDLIDKKSYAEIYI